MKMDIDEELRALEREMEAVRRLRDLVPPSPEGERQYAEFVKNAEAYRQSLVRHKRFRKAIGLLLPLVASFNMIVAAQQFSEEQWFPGGINLAVAVFVLSTWKRDFLKLGKGGKGR
jgi:hypothetical protein